MTIDIYEAFRTLIHHEANELQARSRHAEVNDLFQHAFLHQARGLIHALEIFDALHSGKRPSAGLRSRGAYHFHEYGELLPLGSAECFPAMPPMVRLDNGAFVQFYAVHQLECDEAFVCHLNNVSPKAVVRNDD